MWYNHNTLKQFNPPKLFSPLMVHTSVNLHQGNSFKVVNENASCYSISTGSKAAMRSDHMTSGVIGVQDASSDLREACCES